MKRLAERYGADDLIVAFGINELHIGGLGRDRFHDSRAGCM